MKRQSDQRPDVGLRKAAAILAVALSLLLVSSCATVQESSPKRFSLGQVKEVAHENGHLMGTVNYGAGFFFPSSSDILDISLLRTDPNTGLMTEISHLRYRNIQKFPLPFSVVYDKADVSEGDYCTLIVSLSIEGSVHSQAVSQIQFINDAFGDVSLTLLGL